MPRFALVALIMLMPALCLMPDRVWSQETVATMPIADLHFHPENNKKPAELKEAIDRAGVRWFGLGERIGGPPVMSEYKQAFGDRFIAFGGQSLMNQILIRGGSRAMENPNDEQFLKLLAYLDQGLGDKSLVGIGELFVNNQNTNAQERMRRKMVIDGPVIRALFDLAVKHEAFLAFHMEGNAESVAQLERLAASNRKGRIILNHCGINLPPSEIDRLFTAHANLFCEISVRYPPMVRGKVFTRIFDSNAIGGGWKEVIVKHADRFMVGTDAEGNNGQYIESIKNVRSGLLANLPIEAARQVAYGNAQALFGLK